MKPILSILMPAIRQYNWDKIYDSITQSTQRSFELIVVGPIYLTEKLHRLANVKFLKDYGNPNRCWNLAAILAEGKYTTWCSDDGFYTPNTLDKAINILEESTNEKLIVSMATTEAGFHYSRQNAFIHTHPEISSPLIPEHYQFLALAVFHTSYLLKLGGLNLTMFETYAMAHMDISIRAQDDGAEIVFMDDVVLNQGHMPGRTGDHGPIHDAQTEYDELNFKEFYRNKDRYRTYGDQVCWPQKIYLDINDWKTVPQVWERRFQCNQS